MPEELGQIVFLFIAAMGSGVLVAFSQVEAGRAALFVSGVVALAILIVINLAQLTSLIAGHGWLPLVSVPFLHNVIMMLALFGGFGLGGWLMLRPLR